MSEVGPPANLLTPLLNFVIGAEDRQLARDSKAVSLKKAKLREKMITDGIKYAGQQFSMVDAPALQSDIDTMNYGGAAVRYMNMRHSYGGSGTGAGRDIYKQITQAHAPKVQQGVRSFGNLINSIMVPLKDDKGNPKQLVVGGVKQKNSDGSAKTMKMSLMSMISSGFEDEDAARSLYGMTHPKDKAMLQELWTDPNTGKAKYRWDPQQRRLLNKQETATLYMTEAKLRTEASQPEHVRAARNLHRKVEATWISRTKQFALKVGDEEASSTMKQIRTGMDGSKNYSDYLAARAYGEAITGMSFRENGSGIPRTEAETQSMNVDSWDRAVFAASMADKVRRQDSAYDQQLRLGEERIKSAKLGNEVDQYGFDQRKKNQVKMDEIKAELANNAKIREEINGYALSLEKGDTPHSMENFYEVAPWMNTELGKMVTRSQARAGFRKIFREMDKNISFFGHYKQVDGRLLPSIPVQRAMARKHKDLRFLKYLFRLGLRSSTREEFLMNKLSPAGLKLVADVRKDLPFMMEGETSTISELAKVRIGVALDTFWGGSAYVHDKKRIAITDGNISEKKEELRKSDLVLTNIMTALQAMSASTGYQSGHIRRLNSDGSQASFVQPSAGNMVTVKHRSGETTQFPVGSPEIENARNNPDFQVAE